MKAVVFGGYGFLGSRVASRLELDGYEVHRLSKRNGWDLRYFFPLPGKVDLVVNCAADQGGIGYQKTRIGEIVRDNMLIAANCIEMARQAEAKKYVQVIAACAYPGEPRDGILREDEFTAGPMDASVSGYGSVQRSKVALAKAYHQQYGLDTVNVSLVNLYGPGEHTDPIRSHGLAALLVKFADAARTGASKVTLWGTGAAVREWTHVEDAAAGLLHVANSPVRYDLVNIGTGTGLAMRDLATMLAREAGFQGEISYDSTKGDGVLHKVADISRAARLGWLPVKPLVEGIREELAWYAETKKVSA